MFYTPVEKGKRFNFNVSGSSSPGDFMVAEIMRLKRRMKRAILVKPIILYDVMKTSLEGRIILFNGSFAITE